MVSQMDLAASLGALTGGEVPEGLDGENILEALMGKSDTGRRELVLEANGRLAMREGDFAIIPPYRGRETNITGNELGNLPSWGLFDIASDPGQRVDISASQPEKLEQMKEKFLSLTAGYYKSSVKEVPLQ
jgi:arylsulfatase A-like enzyme